MKTVYVHKAQALVNHVFEENINEIEHAVISIGKELPPMGTLSLDLYDKMLGDDAHHIAETLYKALPGRTLELLIANLMTRRASQLIVPLTARDTVTAVLSVTVEGK